MAELELVNIAEELDQVANSIDATLAAMAGTRMLVTGGAGFLCGYLVDVVAAWNRAKPASAIDLVVLDNVQTGTRNRLSHLAGRKDVQFLEGDVSQPISIEGSIDWIIHGASIASPIVYRRYPLETIDANVGGTRRLLDLAVERQSRGFILMSTSEVYGDPAPEMVPTPETYHGNVSCTGPRACYDESKRLAETLAMTYWRLHGTPVKMIRPFNVFGPGLRLDDGRVLPDFLRAALEGRPIELLSDGRPTRTFCYVSDAVRAMLLLLAAPVAGEAFNVGNDEGEISMGDLAKIVSRVSGKELGSQPVNVTLSTSSDRDYLTDNPQRRCPDLTKLRSTVDWRPQVALEDGLARMIRSLRSVAA